MCVHLHLTDKGLKKSKSDSSAKYVAYEYNVG